MAGVVEVNLRDQSYQLIWSGEVYSEPVEGLTFDPMVQDQTYILKILQNYSELTHVAVFNLKSREFEGIVALDDSIIHYNDSTIEGISFSEIENYLTNSYSNPIQANLPVLLNMLIVVA